MANKDKILLLAMISMLVPGALPEVQAAEGLKKTPKRSAEPARRNGRQSGSGNNTREFDISEQQ